MAVGRGAAAAVVDHAHLAQDRAARTARRRPAAIRPARPLQLVDAGGHGRAGGVGHLGHLTNV